MDSETPRCPARASSLPLLLIGTTFVIATAWLASVLNLWVDEAYTLWTISGDLGDALSRTLDFSHLPPLYFVLMYLWSIGWDSLLLDRLLSILCVAGALVAAWALSRRAFPRLQPALLPLVLATHPLAIWAAVELRLYALTILLSTLLLLLYERIYWSEKPRRLHHDLLLIGVATASLYTQFFLGYLLAGLGAALVATGRRRGAARYLASMTAVAVLCIPMFVLTSRQLGDRIHDVDEPPSVSRQVRLAAERIEAYAFPVQVAIFEQGWSEDRIRVATRATRGLVALAIMTLLLSVRRQPSRLLSARNVAWATVVAVYAGFFVLTISFGGISMVSPRHTIALLVPVLAGTLAWFDAAPRRYLVHAVVAFMVAGNLAASFLRFQPLAKRCDCERVASWIEEREGPGEPILVFFAEDALALRHHYQGLNPIVPVPGDPTVISDTWDPRLYVLRDPRDVARALAEAGPDAEAIWVFKGGTERAFGFEFGREHLERYLDDGWRETERREFFGDVLVRRFERTPAAAATSRD